MAKLPPAERLTGVTLKDNWLVGEKIERENVSWSGASCYMVTRGNKIGFLKAFDLSGLKKAGGRDDHDLLAHRFKREQSILKECTDQSIPGVVEFYDSGVFYHVPDDLNEFVNYFILEYCADGDMVKSIMKGNLRDFASKCAAVRDICGAMEELHRNGVVHLDVKPENLIHFIQERLTKIVDFGSARRYVHDIPAELENELNDITTTYQYAPFECLYNDDEWTTWTEYRKKIDLFLVGTTIVRIFTNMTFTSLVRSKLADKYSWRGRHNHGKFTSMIPYLVEASTKAYVVIKREIETLNIDCGRPLNDDQIRRIMSTIKDLCHPNPSLRGHKEERDSANGSNGLYRYKDRFNEFQEICSRKLKV